MNRRIRIEAHRVRAPLASRLSRQPPGLYAGLAVLATAWLTPLPQLAAPGLAGRMLVNVAVTALAAPLIAGALVTVRKLMARLPRTLVSPMPAALVQFAVLWLWHVPILQGLGRLSPWVWAAGQASLLVAALLLWTTALRTPGPTEGRAGAGILALLVTAMHMALLGTLLAFSPQPLYTYAIESLGDVYAQLGSQRTGGMFILLGGLVHLAGGLYLAGRLLRQPAAAVATAHLGSSPEER